MAAQTPVEELQGLAAEIAEAGGLCQVELIQQLTVQLLERLETLTEPLPAEVYRPALAGMRKARAFRELARTCDRLTRLGYGNGFVKTLHGQALIEQGQITVAIRLLESVIAECPRGNPDRLEAFGLLGRAYKQLYIDERRTPRQAWAAHRLVESIRNYGLGFGDTEIDKANWHAINIAALVWRAEKDGIVLSPPIDRGALTADLIRRLAANGMAPPQTDYDVWNIGVVAQAYLTDGNWDEASVWYGRYAEAAKDDAFKLMGTIRQLKEVYGISCTDDPPGRILAALQTRALKLTSGSATFEVSDLALIEGLTGEGREFQSVLGTNAPVEISWLQTGIRRARSVATIVHKPTEQPIGTGFVVRGGDLYEPFGDRLYLLTNYHVLSEPPHMQAITPDEAMLAFDITAPGQGLPCGRIVWASPAAELDAVLIAVDSPLTGVEPLPIAPDSAVPETLKEGSRRRAYVIGRPQGQTLSISLHDSELIDIGYKHGARTDQIFLHYRTPTRPGNSGSPVFDELKWQVIGLHHMGAPTNGGSRKLGGKPGFNPPANEGIAIRSIRRRLAIDKPAA